jgi:alpha-galactosidase
MSLQLQTPLKRNMTTPTGSLAATPPMGWNSWNMFGNAIDEASIRATAQALVSSGLKACGYNYVVIDDRWSVKTGRSNNGDRVADPHKFPNGMAALVDFVHGLGLKFGIYSDAAELTYDGCPGSYGFEEQDAQLWASWGFDFFKYDYCRAPSDQATAIDRYARMGQALRNAGREFLYSPCEWGGRSPQLGADAWAARCGASPVTSSTVG